jgi:hypothetical protein
MRVWRSILSALILFIISTICSVGLVHAQDPYFAGYYLFGYQFTGYSGVLGDIITINPTVSGNNFIAEWVMEVLKYYPYNWFLQIGYTKGHDTNYQLQYFCQTWDAYSGLLTIFLGSAGSGWHTYYLAHPYDYGESESVYEWRYYIDNTRKHTQELYPYTAIDQQAFVETTTSTIQIDGSHFKRLSYFANQNGEFRWIRWDEHFKSATPPYSVTDMGNYEFIAYGGG